MGLGHVFYHLAEFAEEEVSVREARVRTPRDGRRHELGYNVVGGSHRLEFGHDHIPAAFFGEDLHKEGLLRPVLAQKLTPWCSVVNTWHPSGRTCDAGCRQHFSSSLLDYRHRLPTLKHTGIDLGCVPSKFEAVCTFVIHYLSLRGNIEIAGFSRRDRVKKFHDRGEQGHEVCFSRGSNCF